MKTGVTNKMKIEGDEGEIEGVYSRGILTLIHSVLPRSDIAVERGLEYVVWLGQGKVNCLTTLLEVVAEVRLQEPSRYLGSDCSECPYLQREVQGT